MEISYLDDPSRSAGTDDLEQAGVFYQKVNLQGEIQGDIDALMKAKGYVEQDTVELSPETPNLDSICLKFADEHFHTDDEVRLVLEGEGVFDIRSAEDEWLRVKVEEGDLLVVPAQKHHRFYLTEMRRIRCVRLFCDAAGWVAHYRDS